LRKKLSAISYQQYKDALGVRVLTHPFISSRHRADAEEAETPPALPVPARGGPVGTAMTRKGPKRPDEGTGLTARSGIQKREDGDEG